MSRPSNGVNLKDIGGMWYLVWTDFDPATKKSRSQRRSTRTRDRATAEAILAGFIVERGNNKNVETNVPVSFFLDDYWKNHAHGVESAERISYAIEHLKAHFGVSPVDAVTDLVGEYCELRRAGKIGKRAGNGTLRRELGVLVAAINFAAKKKKIKKSDVPFIPLPEEPAARERWLTTAEAEKLILNSLGRTKLFVQIALNTASRKTAILKLTWAQVDLDRRVINFNPIGRKQTKKRRVACPISDELYPILKTQHEGKKNDDFVLGDAGSVRTGFRLACARAGLKDVTPHTLRHTWATRAAQSRVPMWEIAGVLGDTIATVEKKYAHHHPDYLRAAVNFNKPKESESENGSR